MVTRETGPDRRYGLGRSLQPVVDGLHRQGIAATYFCQEDLPPARIAQREDVLRRICGLPGVRGRVTRQVMARAWIERLHVGFSAGRRARASGATHVHVHDPWIAVGLVAGLLGRGGGRIRWGITEHGFGSYAEATRLDGLEQGPRARRLLRAIERFMLARAHWVLAPTLSALEALAADLRCARALHWHAVPHARPPIAPADAQRRAQARAQLGIGSDALVVLGIGRLVPLKRFDLLLQACAAQRDARLRLVLLGAGDAQALHAQAEALGFGGQLQVAFVEDVTPYLHAADVYVSTSSTESFGLANLEALCAGLPSICTAVGGVPEVMGEAARLIPQDATGLQEALSGMLSEPEKRHHWATRAKARATAWPDADEVTRRYVAIYEEAQR